MIGDTWLSKVSLWYVLDGKRSEPIVQWGATPFRVTRSSGDKAGSVVEDDEAPKKAITDGWTKCLSLLGFTADIRLGMFDDSKYVNDLRYRLEQQEKCEQSLNGNGHANGNGSHTGASPEVMRVAEGSIKAAARLADLAKIRARVEEREDFSAEQRTFLLGIADQRNAELSERQEPAATH